MKILNHFSESESRQFDGDTVKGVTGRIVVGKDDGAPNFCMRVFSLAPGGHTPRHAHEWEHEIFIHAGAGQVLKDGQWQDVSAGSVIFIPGNEDHQFRNTTTDDFVFACLIPKGAPEL